MNLKSKTLSSAITFALVMGANAVIGTGVALAQDQAGANTADDQGAARLDAVQVTGSRIQNQAITATSPVVEIQAEEFKYYGATRSEDLVNQYPQLSPVFDSFQNNGAAGFPSVSLRGLGRQRTLTLVNGNRMPQASGFGTDISIVPSALIKRVDILTGGASAVYGSDAVAGVVNFLLDTEFEGVSVNFGYSAFNHDNDNKFIQGREAARGFDFPTGDSGFDGESESIDVAIGSSFADGRGHAMAWATWRKNDALFQGERDFSACALNAAGTSCGGSATNVAGNFYVYQPVGPNSVDITDDGKPDPFASSGSLNPDGTWRNSYGAPFNFAPINFFQRPDERYTFGNRISLEVNEHFKPFIETMYINRQSEIQVAQSGAFFVPVGLTCDDALVGSLCNDLGIDPANGDLTIYVAKRNVEGGPRNFAQTDENFRIVTGAEGSITDSWSYSAQFIYGRNTQTVIGTNDLLKTRITDALLGCQAGSFSGCLPWNVWQPNSVTVASAKALAGTSLLSTNTEFTEIQAYVTGDLGFGLPTAKGENASVVVGLDWREDQFDFTADSDSQAGNFAGSGGPSLPLGGIIRVKELFFEGAVPLLTDVGLINSVNLDLGYRWSDYNRSGTTNSYKFALGADLGRVKLRGGYNRAIRAPNVNETFSTQQIALFSGSDPCAGATPTFTVEQCVNLGVDPSRFGLIADNPAAQFNQFIGGNVDLRSEKANTWTAGAVFNPTANTYVNVDWYHIKIKDTISTIGAQTILDICGRTGDPTLCSLVKRSATGDIWRGSDPATSGFVTNLTNNFGTVTSSGIDVGAGYGTDLFGGRVDVSLAGTYVLDDQVSPLAGVNDDAAFECAGKISTSCQTFEWRHVAQLRYSRDIWSVGLRWRYFGELDYKGNENEDLFTDKRLCRFDETQPATIPDPQDPTDTIRNPKFGCTNDGSLGAQSYFDLNAAIQLGEFAELTVGANNVLDSRPPITGSTVTANGNSPGGFDQVGRYFFSSLKFTF